MNNYELRKKDVERIQLILEVKDVFTYIELSARMLLDLYDKGLLKYFLDDCQNDSPSVKEFIEYMESRKADDALDGFFFECYIVNTKRDDTRFSIEAISGVNLPQNVLQWAINEFHRADEFQVELDKKCFRAWWDQ